MKSKNLKGEYNLNPTRMIMKQGSRDARVMHERHTDMYNGPAVSQEAHSESKIDRQVTKMAGGEQMADGSQGVETRELAGHEAMKTRMHHHSRHNHGEAKSHEDHHHAVKQLKG